MTRIGDIRRTFGLAIAIWAGLVSVAFARPAIVAELSADLVGVGEEALYTLTVTDAMGGELSLPRFGDLHVNGPSESMQSSISFINGRQTIQTSRVYSWTVAAPQEGRFVIGAATLRHNGESFTSGQLVLRAEGQAPKRPRPQPQRHPLAHLFQDPFDDMPSAQQRRAPTGEDDVFLRAFVDKGSAFLGEQVTLSLYLYSRSDISGVQNISFPKLDGFWAEDLEAPTQLSPEMKNFKGMPYRAYLLRRRSLFPLRAGELVVDPVEATVNLGLSMFFGAPQDSIKRRSAPLKVEVKPLPAEGQPPGFEASNVGEMSLSGSATPTSTPLGQPIQWRVVLEGAGNMKAVLVPKPALPAGLKTYDPTVTDKPRIVAGRYGGTKTLEWIVIPERTGSFALPPIEVTYFDPAQGAYQTARTAPIPIQVSGPPEGSTLAQERAPTQQAPSVANVLEGGIRPIRVNASIEPVDARPEWERGYFWPLASVPALAFGGLWAFGAVGGLLRRRDPEKMRVGRARGRAGKRLDAARALMEKGDGRGFHAEVARALQQFLSEKTGVPALGLTEDALVAALVDKGVADGPAREVTQLIATCEMARFSPSAAGMQDLARTLDEAARLIAELDGFRPGRRS